MSKTYNPPEDASEDIRDYLKEKRGVSKSTYKNHKSVSIRFEKWLRERGHDSILEAETADIRDWLLEQHEEGYGGSTLHTYHSTLRAFFREWTEGDGNGASLLPTHFETNPAAFPFERYINAPKSPKKQQYADNNEGVIYLSSSEIRQLREHVPAPKVRNELVIKILVQTGLRRAELSNLKRKHLKREEGYVIVSAATSKTDEERTVPFDNLEPELSLWLDAGYRDRHTTSDSPYIFITKQTERLKPSRITEIIREAAEHVDTQEDYGQNVRGDRRRRITAHSLRSTFIMRLLEAGIPTPKVMELSGHKSLETVEAYANVLSEDAIEAYNEADIDFGTE